MPEIAQNCLKCLKSWYGNAAAQLYPYSRQRVWSVWNSTHTGPSARNFFTWWIRRRSCFLVEAGNSNRSVVMSCSEEESWDSDTSTSKFFQFLPKILTPDEVHSCHRQSPQHQTFPYSVPFCACVPHSLTSPRSQGCGVEWRFVLGKEAAQPRDHQPAIQNQTGACKTTAWIKIINIGCLKMVRPSTQTFKLGS